MPLFREWAPDEHSLAAVWHITEEEHFFADQVPVRADTIRHGKRRIEFLAGRFLLQYLKNDFPLHAIAKNPNDKPVLPQGPYHFSVSHSYPYVACIIDELEDTGIDIECERASILSVKHKFLTEEESELFPDTLPDILLAWTAKEAAYKYQGLRGVDFRQHLRIVGWKNLTEAEKIISLKLPLISNSAEKTFKSLIDKDFCLSYAIRK
ncbi:MAG: 4'-phosphopantetheinyl transferase superfamily protein [Chitinophagaceae bacterium]